MTRITAVLGLFLQAAFPHPMIASDFAARVIDYKAGPGAQYQDPTKALGPPSTIATPTIPDNSAIVSLGIDGYLILGFDRPIKHNPRNPGGYDFIVFGNSFYVGGNPYVRFQEPAIVEVGVDVNGNGYDVNDPFFVLQGSPNPVYSFNGIDERMYPTWGYADVTPTDGQGNPLIPDDPFSPGITPGSAGGDAFKIEWAVDAQGHPVHLDHVDFIRIRPAGNWSPDVDAVAIVRPLYPPERFLSFSEKAIE